MELPMIWLSINSWVIYSNKHYGRLIKEKCKVIAVLSDNFIPLC